MKLSLAVISFNEEANIGRALAPFAGLADEIVVLDSFSGDRTVAIAREMGAEVYQEPFAGYVAQKNSCLDKCRGRWVFCVDCDEAASPELVESVRRVLEADAAGSGGLADGYLVNRRTFYMGKLLKYAWQPDRKLRLFLREKGRWGGDDPHDTILLDGRKGRLAGDLIHYSYTDFEAHMAQTKNFARRIADSYYARGKKSGPFSILFRPPFVLFKRLFLQRAILDGTPGIIAAMSSALYSYMKYAYLWERWRKRENPPRDNGKA